MYYAEKMINGILHWQSDPNGKWIPYTIAELSHRYDALAQRLAAEVQKFDDLQELYKAVQLRLAAVEKERDGTQQRYEKQCEGTKSRIEKIQFLQTDHARLTKEIQAIKGTVGDEDFYLRQENARLREQLRLANIDAANNEARANDLQQQLAAAQGTWTTEKPTAAGWYWWRHEDTCFVVHVEHNPDFDDFVYREGRDTYGLDDLAGGEWCHIPEPREA